MRQPKQTRDQFLTAGGFRSGLEKLLSYTLKTAGIPFKFEDTDYRIPYIIPASNHMYLADFFFEKLDGTMMFVDTKGRWTSEDRMKHYYLWSQHPQLDIRLLFQANPETMKVTSKVSVAQLCTEGLGYKSRGIDWKPFNRKFAWCKVRQTGGQKYIPIESFPAEWLNDIRR